MNRNLLILIGSAIIILGFALTAHCILNYELKKSLDPDAYVKEAVYRRSGPLNYFSIDIEADKLTAELSSYYYGMNKEYINSRKRSLREKTFNNTYQQICDDLQYKANMLYAETTSKHWIKKVVLTYNRKLIYQAVYKKRYTRPVE